MASLSRSMAHTRTGSKAAHKDAAFWFMLRTRPPRLFSTIILSIWLNLTEETHVLLERRSSLLITRKVLSYSVTVAELWTIIWSISWTASVRYILLTIKGLGGAEAGAGKAGRTITSLRHLRPASRYKSAPGKTA